MTPDFCFINFFFTCRTNISTSSKDTGMGRKRLKVGFVFFV
jgi:hypothetical protein